MRQSVSAQDPLLDFTPETTAMYRERLSISASSPLTQPPTHAIDTTSRVISFVLGFALASLIAWVGSISGDHVAATGNSGPVAAVGTPVVAAAIEKKKPVTTKPLAVVASAPAPNPTPSAATAPPRAAAVASPPPIRVSAPSRTVEPVASEARAPRPSGYRGTLSLSSNPAGAQVVLNGRVVGQTPVVLKDLPVGSRAIIVRRDGYSTWSTSVRIVADQLTIVKANLVPALSNGG